MKLHPVLQLLRPKQWIKNTFVWIAGFFAGNLFAINVLEKNIVAFIVFCATSSLIYIYNDYFDQDKDRLHPTKKHRPIAAGTITNQQILCTIGALLFFIILGLMFLEIPKAWILIGLYIITNILYVHHFKQIPILDLHIIAIGFMLRVFLGGLVSGVPVSHWLILLTYLLSLILALAKRRGEFLHIEHLESRPVLKGYNLQFIDLTMVLLIAVTVMSYIMYSLSPVVMNHFGSQKFYLSTILVVIGLLRYLQLTIVYERTESPTQIIFEDRFIQATLASWILLIGFLLYR